MTALKRIMACNVPTGLHCEVDRFNNRNFLEPILVSIHKIMSSFIFQIIDKSTLKKMHPFLNTDDLEGAIWVPEDAVANPLAICQAFAKLSIEGGYSSIFKITREIFLSHL